MILNSIPAFSNRRIDFLDFDHKVLDAASLAVRDAPMGKGL
jgi:hypothetical protein